MVKKTAEKGVKKRVSFTLNPETLERLKREAEKQGRSVSNFVNFILKKYLKLKT